MRSPRLPVRLSQDAPAGLIVRRGARRDVISPPCLRLILSQRSCRHVLSLRKNGDLDTDVRAILESIDGFEFEVCGDVLHYSYDGDHGTARFSLDTSAGTEFEQDVRNMDTATFEELIPLLRKNRC